MLVYSLLVESQYPVFFSSTLIECVPPHLPHRTPLVMGWPLPGHVAAMAAGVRLMGEVFGRTSHIFVLWDVNGF